MKKIFSLIGLTTIITISFIISEKTATVVKDIDEIMTEIKETQQNYEQSSQSALIQNNTIIPGLNGKKVDIDKTYKEMKKLGTFNEKYIIYKEIKPQITIKHQYDKYIISGNKNKNTISLIFLVHDTDNINEIINILEKNNIKATFFIDGYWLEKNNELTIDLINQGHTIGNLSYNLDYENEGYVWMNNIIKKLGKQKTTYCYAETQNEKNIKACTLQKSYTILPNIITKNNPLTEIKKNITSGSLITLKINEKTRQELQLIIDYIKTKGYNIENIQNHLSEKNS